MVNFFSDCVVLVFVFTFISMMCDVSGSRPGSTLDELLVQHRDTRRQTTIHIHNVLITVLDNNSYESLLNYTEKKKPNDVH